MERKNMVLLTVIAVATLLVAVVGATFAYFTASTKAEDVGGNSANVTTNKLDGATLTFKETGEVLDMLDYPGGLGIYGATATIAKQDDNGDDSNNYQATFDLEITYTNLTGTDLEWELWMLNKKIDELPFSSEGGFESITKCERKEQTDGTKTYYWYADADDLGINYQSQEQCDAENIKAEVKTNGGTLIAYGKFKNGQSGQKITKATQNTDGTIQFNEDESSQQDEDKKLIKKNQLGDRTLNTVDTQSKVYYLVVKYPNKDTDQSSADAGKTIQVKLEVDADTANSTIYNS